MSMPTSGSGSSSSASGVSATPRPQPTSSTRPPRGTRNACTSIGTSNDSWIRFLWARLANGRYSVSGRIVVSSRSRSSSRSTDPSPALGFSDERPVSTGDRLPDALEDPEPQLLLVVEDRVVDAAYVLVAVRVDELVVELARLPAVDHQVPLRL